MRSLLLISLSFCVGMFVYAKEEPHCGFNCTEVLSHMVFEQVHLDGVGNISILVSSSVAILCFVTIDAILWNIDGHFWWSVCLE